MTLARIAIIALATLPCTLHIQAKGCRTKTDDAMRAVYDSYKAELKKSHNGAFQDFLDDTASFRSSKLYGLCQKMPKGADLHVHGSAMLPTDMLMDFLADHPEMKILTAKGKNFGKLKYYPDGLVDIPAEWMSMQDALSAGFTQEDFVKAWTLKGADGLRAWDWFNGIFRKMSELTSTPELEEDYYTRAFRYYISQGVSHIEPRLLFFGSHEEALAKARAVYRAVNAARAIDPDFSVSIVFCGLKAKTDSYNKSEFNGELFDNGLFISENIKDTVAGGNDLVTGFDLVNEEDQSIPLAHFKELIDQTKAKKPSLHITLHAGETVRTDNNEIASAIMLGAERIGHGFNLHQHPALKGIIASKGITLECCPISNKTLGYCSDLRQHPASAYMRENMAVSICDDDPAYQMRSSLVDDLFAAAFFWDLSIDDIKQLCKNSINGAFLPKANKSRLLKAWEKKWNAFEKEAIRIYELQN